MADTLTVGLCFLGLLLLILASIILYEICKLNRRIGLQLPYPFVPPGADFRRLLWSYDSTEDAESAYELHTSASGLRRSPRRTASEEEERRGGGPGHVGRHQTHGRLRSGDGDGADLSADPSGGGGGGDGGSSSGRIGGGGRGDARIKTCNTVPIR